MKQSAKFPILKRVINHSIRIAANFNPAASLFSIGNFGFSLRSLRSLCLIDLCFGKNKVAN